MKQVHIFTNFGTVRSFFDGQFKYLAECGWEIIVVSCFHSSAKDFCYQNNIRFYPIAIPRALAPIALLKVIYRLIKLIKTEKPDAVFGHTPVGAFCSMIASKLCGIKNRIYYRHGVIYTTMIGVKKKIFLWEERLVSYLASAIINVSPSLSNLAIKDGLNPEFKNNIIGDGTCGGIDAIDIFNPDLINPKVQNIILRDLGLKSSSPCIVFGFCGRICKDKGIPELIDGFKLFQKINHNITSKLILIGDYDERDILPQSFRNEIEYNLDIILTGFIDKSIISYYYSIIDVFVFPSHREGFGMSVLEASAMRKPILVSKSHGCIDTIKENITGLYIDLSAQGVCEGMMKMLDKEKRNILGQNGRQMVLDKYDIRIMWPLVYNLYKKIII